jgi:putative transcriptional regulator
MQNIAQISEGKSQKSDDMCQCVNRALAPPALRSHSVFMITTLDYSDLTGKLLIAMPDMGDPRFAQSVVYMCAHSEDGSMGLIINKPNPSVQFGDLLEQLSITPETDVRPIRVYFGGPVEHGRGFVLHSSDYRTEASTLQVNDTFGLTSTLDILEDIALGAGPEASLMALGYSGWGPGQLETEIRQNGWLVCDATPDLVFQRPNSDKWSGALKTLGLDPLSLSSTAGRA